MSVYIYIYIYIYFVDVQESRHKNHHTPILCGIHSRHVMMSVVKHDALEVISKNLKVEH